jgi:hypothetical protein
MKPRIAERSGDSLLATCPFCFQRHAFPLEGRRGLHGWYITWSSCEVPRAFYYGGKRRKVIHFVVLDELNWVHRERFAS